jgi:hypothetical protein
MTIHIGEKNFEIDRDKLIEVYQSQIDNRRVSLIFNEG